MRSKLQNMTSLLDLSGITVTDCHFREGNQLEIHIESNQLTATCPVCGLISKHWEQAGEPQVIADLPVWNWRCWLHYRPRIYSCGFCQTSFIEPIIWRRPGSRYTERYEAHLRRQANRATESAVARERPYFLHAPRSH